MLRRSKLLALLLLVGGVLTTVSVLFALAKHAPSFHSQSPPEADFNTRLRAAQLLTRIQDLKNEIRSKPEWGDTFSTDDLNCFFVENMGNKGRLSSMLPENLHSPRIAIEDDRIKLGFKYGEGFWSTVIWVELRVWLVANEENLVAIEVCDLRMGLLPLGSQSILDSISEAARDSSVEVTWYRNGSHPIGLFRFFAGQQRAPSQIRTLQARNGNIVIAGKSPDQSPIASATALPVAAANSPE